MREIKGDGGEGFNHVPATTTTATTAAAATTHDHDVDAIDDVDVDDDADALHEYESDSGSIYDENGSGGDSEIVGGAGVDAIIVDERTTAIGPVKDGSVAPSRSTSTTLPPSSPSRPTQVASIKHRIAQAVERGDVDGIIAAATEWKTLLAASVG